MFKDEHTAKQVSEMMLDISGRLEQSVAEIKQTCTPEEYRARLQKFSRNF
jgi:hypothetical protein